MGFLYFLKPSPRNKRIRWFRFEETISVCNPVANFEDFLWGCSTVILAFHCQVVDLFKEYIYIISSFMTIGSTRGAYERLQTPKLKIDTLEFQTLVLRLLSFSAWANRSRFVVRFPFKRNQRFIFERFYGFFLCSFSHWRLAFFLNFSAINQRLSIIGSQIHLNGSRKN